MNFFYIFVFVLIVAISYVVYSMSTLPKLGENHAASSAIMIVPKTFLS